MEVEAKQIRLSLKRKWFEMTALGIKTEDYREITPRMNRILYCCMNDENKIAECVRCKKSITDVTEIKKCYDCLFGVSYLKNFDHNIMTLGYPSKNDESRILRFEHAGIEIRTGNPEWGAEPNKLYFVIKHGARI